MNDLPAHASPIEVLNAEQSALWRQLYIEAFVDTSLPAYRDQIAVQRRFSDGMHHEGYLWEAIRSPLLVTIERVKKELDRRTEVMVMADDHSRDRVTGAPLWPYAANAVARFATAAVISALPALPEDLYIFDQTMGWTLVPTHEHNQHRRICVSMGLPTAAI